MQGNQPVTAAAKDIRRSRDDRKLVLMTGTLVTPSGNQQVRIHDISSKGAHVSTDRVLKADTEVFLTKRSIWAAAWVAWTDDRHAGLKFYRELRQDEIDSIFRHD